MCRPYGWVSGPKILQTRVTFFGRFSLNMGRLSRNLRKIVKDGWFPPKFIVKVVMTASFGN